ncbi:hypothetical protein HU200_048729 [Digitaria exilis]|uniref:DUF295 domain-containing protein n=1 Tax=Digitaria exilis TaxID=1010633 RepID=A0A835EBL1_9POAL|nr:hypothetical protein HU200_048729 [Digitaria exilis]
MISHYHLVSLYRVVHSVAPTQTRCSTKCAQASETPRSDEAQDPQHRPWADLPADILGVVVGLFSLVEDRARLRSVCHAWRTAARIHRRPPTPLPLLVMSEFKFASFCTEGILTGARRRIPLPERETASAGNVRCVGSFEGWLGTLYMLSWREFSLHLIAFEICEDNNGLMISRVEGSVVQLPVVTHDYYETWSPVEWRGKLLIVSTYSGFTEFGHMIAEVNVFEADLSTNPVRLSEIKNLGGDCIFISPCNSKSFRSSDYDGVGEHLIYFTHGNLYPENFVYNMKDGEPFDEMPLKKPRLDTGSELPPPPGLWAEIHPDILGVVLRWLVGVTPIEVSMEDYSSDNLALALWQPGMMSWHVCSGLDINGLKDITFYQGKLYIFHMFTKRLLAFVLDEDDRGIVVSRVEQCVTESLPPHPMGQNGLLNYDMVVWRGNLLLIARYYNDFFRANHKVIKVKVFAVDFSINPYGLTKIHSFDGDCIFIGSGSSKSFPASLHDGVEDVDIPPHFEGAAIDGDIRFCNAVMNAHFIDWKTKNSDGIKGPSQCDALAIGSYVVLGEMPQDKRERRTDMWSRNHPLGPPWASLHADAMGVVLTFLPCLPDRARVRSVCHKWRAVARSRGRSVQPPLPLLVFPKLRFSSLTAGGLLTAMRQAWMPREVGPKDDIIPVGSSGDWIVCARLAAGECFMLNAFSYAVLKVPHLGTSSDFSLRQVVFSSSPLSSSSASSSSGPPPPNYTMAAYMIRHGKTELSLWSPGMKTWRVYEHALFAGHVDIIFYQENLYMLWRFTPCLFALELGKDEEDGVIITSMKDCLVEKLLPNALVPTHETSCNMVEWKGRLLLIIRYHQAPHHCRNMLVKVEVFVMDLSVMPCGLTQIHSLGNDCIFVGTGGCKSFSAGQHAGVEGDLIYFGPDHCNPHAAFAYSMRDRGTRAIVETKPLPCVNNASPKQVLGYPVWLFPSE